MTSWATVVLTLGGIGLTGLIGATTTRTSWTRDHRVEADLLMMSPGQRGVELVSELLGPKGQKDERDELVAHLKDQVELASEALHRVQLTGSRQTQMAALTLYNTMLEAQVDAENDELKRVKWVTLVRANQTFVDRAQNDVQPGRYPRAGRRAIWWLTRRNHRVPRLENPG